MAYGYGWRNSGDLAINQGSLKFINTLSESVRPQVISIHPEESDEFQKTSEILPWDDLRYDLIGGPMHYDPKTQSTVEQYARLSGDGLRYALDLFNGRIRDTGQQTRMAREIKSSDFLFYNGGNLIHHNRNLPYLMGILYPLQVAKWNDIQYGLLPHTIFDIEGRYEPLITSILEGAEFVWTRDSRSYDYLSSEFSLSTPILNGIDTAFFLDVPTVSTDDVGDSSDPHTVAVVPRFSTLGDTGDLEEDDAEQQFKRFLARLTNAGHEVVLTVQTKVEEEWVENNKEVLDEHEIDVFTSYDPQELRAHYDDVDLLVTMRLHAGIFALSVGTPTIGLYREGWGPKTPGTWENLGIDSFSLSNEEMTVETLLALCDRVFDEYTSIQETIKETITMRKQYMINETSRLLPKTDP
jgi:polysaccharide pyruvyl transferase WcaK-like protein